MFFFNLFSCCYKSSADTNIEVEENVTFSAIYQDQTLESNLVRIRNL